VAPWLSLFTITPICPHSLSSRPIVLPTDSDLTVTFPEDEPGARLTVDGQLEYPVSAGGKVVVRKADYEVNMITFEDRDYFQTLRTKMGWGQHNGGGN
jgi:NAD+ kinase